MEVNYTEKEEKKSTNRKQIKFTKVMSKINKKRKTQVGRNAVSENNMISNIFKNCQRYLNS